MDLKKPISGALSALVLTSAVTPLSLALEYEQSTKPPVAVHGSAPETTQPKLAVLYSSQNILTLAAYDTKLAQFSGTASEKAANPAYETLLLQRRLVEKAGYDALTAKMEQDENFAACMEWLFSDAEMLRYYVYGGEPEANGRYDTNKTPTAQNYLDSFAVLSKLYAKHKADVTTDSANKALYQRMMAALALTHSVPVYDWWVNSGMVGFNWRRQSEPVERYEIYKNWYLHKMLAVEFPKLNVEEMRLVMGAPTDNDQLQWAHYYIRAKVWKESAETYTNSPKQVRSQDVPAYGLMFPYKVTSFLPTNNIGSPYFTEANRQKWDDKYTFSLHNEVFNFDLLYGPSKAGDEWATADGQYYPPMWVWLEVGGVCVNISCTSTVAFNAFGIPCTTLTQPAHLTYYRYTEDSQDNSKVVWWHGYDVYHIQQSSSKDDGHTHIPSGWGDLPYTSYDNGAYIFLGMDAVRGKHGTDYAKAENLAYMAEIALADGRTEDSIGLFQQALEAQSFNLSAFDGLARAYEQAGKTDEDYYALAEKAAAALKWYPLPMHDYLVNCLQKKCTSVATKADIVALAGKTLDDAIADYQSSGLDQPDQVKNVATYLKGRILKAASFSFDSGALTLNSSYKDSETALQYSLDGGANWTTWTRQPGEISRQLTAEELAAISEEHDFQFRFLGAKKIHTIDITKGTAPVSNAKTNTPDDNEDVFLNLQSGLEYSTDSGATWSALTVKSTFPGDTTVWLRKKATGTALASPHIEVKFTANEGTPERSYLKLKGSSTIVSHPDENLADKAFDGNIDTYWENNYARGYEQDSSGNWVSKHTYEFVLKFDQPHYLSAMTYLPYDMEGAIRGIEIYTSTDGENWQLAAATKDWDANTQEKSLEFERPALAGYVKIKTTKVGTKEFMGFMVGYATAKEFRFYENYAVKSKEIEGWSVNTDSTKKQYQVGDKLDLNGIEAVITYTDGSTALIPASALERSVDVFTSAATKEVTLRYEGLTASYPVTVKANDRTATEIVQVTATQKKYYAGDTVAPADLQVLVTDGKEQWYLLPGEFTISGVLAEGTTNLSVQHNTLSKTFSVTAEKAVTSLKLEQGANVKTQYFLGDALDMTDLTVKQVLADGTEQLLTADEYTLSVIDGASVGGIETLSKTAGSKKLRFALKDKPTVYTELDITVLQYITSGPFRFEAVEGTTQCVLSSYDPTLGTGGSLAEIPETVTVGGVIYTVTDIASNAFAGAGGSVDSVSIPKTVTSIRKDAFTACSNLKNVYMTGYSSLNSLTVEAGAFPAVSGGLVYLASGLTGTANSPIPGYTVAGLEAQVQKVRLTPPEKTSYLMGEELDDTGLQVNLIMKDGSRLEAQNVTLSGYDPSVTGQQTVTAAVGGTNLTATFQVEVRFPAITMLISPKGAAYGENDTIQPLTVKAAAGAHTVRYRWYKLGENGEKTVIPGADGASYLPTEAGSYAAAAYLVDSKGQTSNEVLSATAKIEVGSFVAIVNGSGYASLAEVIANAPDGSTVQLCKDVTVAQAIEISGKKLTLDGSGHRMDRGNGYGNEFIALRNSADLTVKNITLDGGAQWIGAVDDILQRGTTNSGMKAGRPLILTRTQAQLTLGSGAVLQNNDNQANAYSGKVDGTAPFGGAVQIGDGILALNGGEIRNCNSAVFGGAAHIRGSSTFTAKAGTVSGNNAGSYAAICLDNTARSIVEGGEFSNNKSGNNGGVFWLKEGTLSITGGVFENNSTAGKGGVAYQDKASASVSLKGGVFRNNRAKGDGGVLYTPNGLSISGGSYEGNTSGGNGGAVWTNGMLSLSGGSFRDNTAQKGAAIYQEGGKEVTITGFEEMQEIYLKTLGTITIQNELKGKRLPLQTESAVTDGMTVATLMVARPQEYGAVTTLNGNTVLAVQDGTAGWFLKVDQAAQVCTVTYHTDGGSIQNQSNYESYRVGVGLTLPIPTKEGFLFRGWYLTSDFSGEAVTALGTDANGNKTFYAKWEKDEPLVDAAKPAEITLLDASYEAGKTAEPLNGKTTVTDNGTITYQWYEATSKDEQNGKLLEGKTAPTFTPDTTAVGTRYYYVVATNTNEKATGKKTAETRSNTVQITVQELAPVKTFIVRYEWNGEAPSDAKLPQDDRSYGTEEQARAAMDTTYAVGSTSTAQKDGKDGTWSFSGWTATVENTVVKFTGKWTFTETIKVDAAKPAEITLADASYTVGDSAAALNGETTVTDNGEITYQWYEATSKDDQNGKLLEGKTAPSFTPDTTVAGTRFYYVVATNTNANATGEQTAETRSNTVAITVTKKAVTYTVSYDWGTDFPNRETLPADSREYQSVQDAEAAMDKTYTASSTSTAQKDGKDGTWTFSGWTARVENTVVKFIGEWTFTETIKVDAAKPAEITLADTSYTVGDNATALDGTTTANDGGEITYQWYEATSKDEQNGKLLEGKTDPTFAPDTTATGTRFYYVVATNTNANATGEKTAETRSNTVAITVTEKAVTYTVSYDWGTEFPEGVTLPTDSAAYQSVQDAETAVDKTYTAGFTSNAQKDGKDGTWTFSGWTVTVENTVVKFTGKWAFTETLKVNAAKPAPITLTDASYTVGDSATALNGETTVTDNGEITYQWYEATSKDDQNGTLLEGKTDPTFTPDTAVAGTRFYYVVATNTNANATGEKTAETRNNTVQITVQEPAPVEMFTVRYEWDGEAPSDAKLPQDDHTYDTEEQARAAMDTTYAVGSTSTARKDGKDGTWTFSGWTTTVENTVVKFTGKWTFTETPVRPGRPSSGGSSDRDQNHSVSAPSHINGGAVSVTPAAAPKGTTVTITAKPDNGYKLDKLTVTDQSGNRLSLNDQGNGKYTFTMPSGKVNVDAAFSKIAASVSFRDVKQSDYYYDAVKWAVEKGITEGTSAETFSPHASCTRAQTVTFLWRAAGSPEPTGIANPFSDLSPNAYYYKAVLWAVENGITQGTSTDTFSPDATVTRGQTVTFLHRAAGAPSHGGNAAFFDISDDDYYSDAVAWAEQNGITSGTGNGKFAPNAVCTRAQIVTLLYRADN